MYYATESERDEAAKDAIDGHMDDGWSDSVTQVVAGVLTHKTMQCDVVKMPENLDEDNIDEQGVYWSSEFTYLCDYKLFPINNQ